MSLGDGTDKPTCKKGTCKAKNDKSLLKDIQYNHKTLNSLVTRLQVQGGDNLTPILGGYCSQSFPSKYRTSSFTYPSTSRTPAEDYYCELIGPYFISRSKVLTLSLSFPGVNQRSNLTPNLKNFSGGLNLSRGLNMVGST